jgi:hypothetical protein
VIFLSKILIKSWESEDSSYFKTAEDSATFLASSFPVVDLKKKGSGLF